MSSFFPLLIFFVSFATYLFTALPSIYWRDAPEFQAIGFLLDIAHPAGSPLYSIIIKLATFIPMGSIAFKTTLVSAVFGAGLSVLIYMIIQSLLEQLSEEGASSTRIQSVGFFTTLLFSFSNALWENSNMPEVYTLQNCFTALFILILLKSLQCRGDQNSRRRIFQLFLSLSFIFGLSLGAHAILFLYLPFLFLFVYFIWLKSGSINAVKIFATLSFFFLLGVSVYLYLPIRSVQNPYYDWGDPETFENLMRHTSDRKDASVHFNLPTDVLPSQISSYMAFYPDNFSFLGIVLGITGLVFLIAKRQKVPLILLAIFFFPPFLFFIRYWGEASAYLPTFIIFTILIGVGVWVVFTMISERLKNKDLNIKYSSVISVLFGIQFCLLLSNHFVENHKVSNYWTPREIMKGILDELPFQAVVMSNHTWFAFTYLQKSEGYRPDLTILSLSSIVAPDFFSKIEQSKFPNVVIPNVPSDEMGSAILTENIDSRPIYWEPNVERNYLLEEHLIPDGFLFKVEPAPPDISNEMVQSYVSKFPKHINLDKPIDDVEERTFYAEVISGQGSLFLERGVYEIALDHFKMAVSLIPNSFHLNRVGVGYAYMNELPLAEKFFQKSIKANPNDYQAYLNMGELLVVRKMPQKAETYFKKALTLHPKNIRSLFHMGKINAKKGNNQEALKYFQQALEIDPNYEDVKIKVDQLLKE